MFFITVVLRVLHYRGTPCSSLPWNSVFLITVELRVPHYRVLRVPHYRVLRVLFLTEYSVFFLTEYSVFFITEYSVFFITEQCSNGQCSNGQCVTGQCSNGQCVTGQCSSGRWWWVPRVVIALWARNPHTVTLWVHPAQYPPPSRTARTMKGAGQREETGPWAQRPCFLPGR